MWKILPFQPIINDFLFDCRSNTNNGLVLRCASPCATASAAFYTQTSSSADSASVLRHIAQVQSWKTLQWDYEVWWINRPCCFLQVSNTIGWKTAKSASLHWPYLLVKEKEYKWGGWLNSNSCLAPFKTLLEISGYVSTLSFHLLYRKGVLQGIFNSLWQRLSPSLSLFSLRKPCKREKSLTWLSEIQPE